MTCLM